MKCSMRGAGEDGRLCAYPFCALELKTSLVLSCYRHRLRQMDRERDASRKGFHRRPTSRTRQMRRPHRRWLLSSLSTVMAWSLARSRWHRLLPTWCLSGVLSNSGHAVAWGQAAE
ncbi:hypothetical protein BR93DRAFT_237767 [Coniochaeta sp. PMI_546]|nr:hypothetical protein BR93DRAFT_237767 [Coniochaeta sp. PMI_546]